MTEFEAAIAEVQRRPKAFQDWAAQLLRDALEDEERWDKTFDAERSQRFLAGKAAEVRAMIREGHVTDFDPEKL